MIPAAEKEKMRKKISSNEHEIYVLSLEEMDVLVNKYVKTPSIKKLWQQLRSSAEIGANNFSSGKDTFLLAKVVGDMGGMIYTKAYIKYYKTKPYIIFKGNPRLRTLITGTRYGLNSLKVVRLGLGKYGAQNAIKSGGWLTIYLLAGYRILDYVLRDGATLNELIGSLATDVVKVGLSTGAAIAFAAGTAALSEAMAATFIVAIGPLAVGIIIGTLASGTLTWVDNKFKITDKIIAALDEISDKGIKGIIEEKRQAMVKKSGQLAGAAVDSVIDYAVEKAERIVVEAFRNLFSNIKIPQI